MAVTNVAAKENMRRQPERDAAFFNRLGREHLPEYLGVQVTEVQDGLLRASLTLKKNLFAPNGFLHAGTIVTLADTATGYACVAHLPQGAQSFTTLELKANFLGTAKSGSIHCEARAVHLGRTTQVWDATVTADESNRTIAMFRCTQMILYPR
jgi:uncharacterized protein (TIGR00369 family)